MTSTNTKNDSSALRCGRLVSLRCPDCKSDISEPETLSGEIPQDEEAIVCPTCGARYLRFFWIPIYEAQTNAALCEGAKGNDEKH